MTDETEDPPNTRTIDLSLMVGHMLSTCTCEGCTEYRRQFHIKNCGRHTGHPIYHWSDINENPRTDPPPE